MAEREQIFEPFVTTKPVGQGTGLGLFVCRNIIDGLGGQISVHDRPGGGALFRVELPAAQPRAAEHPPSPAVERRSASTWKVLVIDDDVRVAEALAFQLKRAGMIVAVVTDGHAAPAVLLGADDFDLIYCDLMMGRMTGMDLAELLESRATRILARTVFMTGGAFTPRGAAFVANHPDTCVEKPFDIVAETHRRLGTNQR